MPLSDGRRVQSAGPEAKPSLVDTVHMQLRERVILGEIEGGDMLVESQLAKEFGVSKTPVREALVRLSQEGYVEVIPRQGYQVTAICVKDIHEVYELRAVLEPEAAALAAQRATPEEHTAFRAEMGELSIELESKDGPVTTLDVMALDDAFHMGIANLTGNRRLAAAIKRLLREAMRLRFTDPHESPEGMLSEGHTTGAILEAVGKGKATTARQLMLEHIEQSKERGLAGLLNPLPGTKIHVRGR